VNCSRLRLPWWLHIRPRISEYDAARRGIVLHGIVSMLASCCFSASCAYVLNVGFGTSPGADRLVTGSLLIAIGEGARSFACTRRRDFLDRALDAAHAEHTRIKEL
jgi:hypothetical protein